MNEQPYLSILLPSYNNRCYPLVHALKQQADAIDGLRYEIIVADDGSRDQVAVISNYLINELEYCRYIRRHENVGRSRIRNFLISEARGEWLLFLDSDLSIVRDDFLSKYLTHANETALIDGGVTIIGDSKVMRHNLRFCYEQKSEPLLTAEKRNLSPYQHIRTTNLLVPRSVMMANPFDERVTHYGYEDVLLGRQLQSSGINIVHIDNPIGIEKFETNDVFISKTEESLRTLHHFSAELHDYSTLLLGLDRLKRYHLLPFIRLWHILSGNMERRNLLSKSPSLLFFKLYKIGYYTTLK